MAYLFTIAVSILLAKADTNILGLPDLAGKLIAADPGTATETALTTFLREGFVTYGRPEPRGFNEVFG
jgi:ABC-type amino acid transport substrate-binding protein